MKGGDSEAAPRLRSVAAARGKVARLRGFVNNLQYDSLSIDGYLVVNFKSPWRGRALLFQRSFLGFYITQSAIHHRE